MKRWFLTLLMVFVSVLFAYSCNLESDKKNLSNDDDDNDDSATVDDDDAGVDDDDTIDDDDDDDDDVDDDDNDVSDDDDDIISDSCGDEGYCVSGEELKCSEGYFLSRMGCNTAAGEFGSCCFKDDFDECSAAGGVCHADIMSSLCPEGYDLMPYPEIECVDENDYPGHCCLPLDENECNNNYDCVTVPSGCCSCGFYEEDFIAVTNQQEEEYLKNLEAECGLVNCEPCPPSIPENVFLPVCNEQRRCELSKVKAGCMQRGESVCIASESVAFDGCPSNWGSICGCTYTVADIEMAVCGGAGASLDCQYDDLGCPQNCECKGPWPMPEFPDEPEMYSCLEDADCTEVRFDCCLCGGVSVNQDYVNDWNDWLNLKRSCNQVECGPPTWCPEGEPICHHGRCSFKEPSGEIPCAADECLLGMPCDCEKDLYGCTVQECVPRVKECRSDGECGNNEKCWYGDGCVLTPDGVECNPNGDGHCHNPCDANHSCANAAEKCYDVINSYGDVAESLSICLNIY